MRSINAVAVRQKTGWQGLLLLLASLVICLLLAEGATRLFFGHRIVLYPRFHDEVTYGDYTIRRLKPHTTFRHQSVDGTWEFVINSRGFRATTEHPYEKPGGTLRIFCLGDSHTQGFECRQDRTYAAVMQRYFDERGVPAEVINAGVSGFGTAEALVLLENEVIRYAPDAVVLGFFANDLEDNVKADLFRLEGGRLTSHGFRHTPAAGILRIIHALPPLCWLSQNSYLYSCLFNGAWDWGKRRLLDRKTVELTTEYAVRPPESQQGTDRQQQLLSSALLGRMYRFCQQHGIEFVLLDIPYVDPDGGDEWYSSVAYGFDQLGVPGCDMLLESTDLLGDYRGMMDVCVPHGQRHISETTHMLLGVAAAKQLGRRLGYVPVALAP